MYIYYYNIYIISYKLYSEKRYIVVIRNYCVCKKMLEDDVKYQKKLNLQLNTHFKFNIR